MTYDENETSQDNQWKWRKSNCKTLPVLVLQNILRLHIKGNLREPGNTR